VFLLYAFIRIIGNCKKLKVSFNIKKGDFMKRVMSVFMLVVLIIAVVITPGASNISAEPDLKIQPAPTGKVPAFPGAEGGGMYTTGGRGGEVYEVTNLNDSGEGSLRDAVSKGNRTVVFRVSGNIELESPLNIAGSNITIAGQTAPGDGICIKNYGVEIGGDNIIIRYIRVRPGDSFKNQQDAFTCMDRKNLIIDHCSFSWSTDEVCSPYQNENVTVQWSIIAESLKLSSHPKGAHGYGAIFGGINSTYHHNLILHHSSRNPRFDGNGDGTIIHNNDYVNNVVYNWGFNSAYGGEVNVYTNMIANYYKPGPDTLKGVMSRIFDAIDKDSKLYVAENYVEGSAEVTADNWKGVKEIPSEVNKLSEPVQTLEIAKQSAQDAYKAVLENAGATLPKRDALDQRYVNDVINGTGRQINSQEEVGGWPELTQTEPPVDTDHDGMPDEWEKANGLDPQNPDDRNDDNDNDGYTNLEEYLNSITTNGSKNPTVKISNISDNAVFDANSSVTITAEASDSDGEIEKVVFYDGSTKIGEVQQKPYSIKIDAIEEGEHYLSAVAIDNTGTKTQSAVLRVYANENNTIEPWASKDIGSVKISGSSSLADDILTIKGTGKIGDEKDAFHYTYQKLSGDGEITAKITFVKPKETDATAGIMIRESLDDDSPTALLALAYKKEMTKKAVFKSRDEKGAKMQSVTEQDISDMPYWLKLVRKEGKITAYISRIGGEDWEEIGSVEDKMRSDVYIGFSIDSNQSDNNICNYYKAEVSDILLTGNITSAREEGLSLGLPVYIAAGAVIAVILFLLMLFIIKRKKKNNKDVTE